MDILVTVLQPAIGDWYVLAVVDDAATPHTPATELEAAMCPGAFARLVAERVGGTYLAPNHAAVNVDCGKCGAGLSWLIEDTRPRPSECYRCANGLVLPKDWPLNPNSRRPFRRRRRRSVVLTASEVAA